MATDRGEPGWLLGTRLLLASRALFEELHHRLAEAGHDGLRPAHGFVFQSLGAAGASASEIAERLGVTKQAARLIVEELVELGYVERGRDPGDRRRRPVRLTSRGDDALRRSERIFDDLRGELATELDPAVLAAGQQLLSAIDARYGPAPLRPVW